MYHGHYSVSCPRKECHGIDPCYSYGTCQTLGSDLETARCSGANLPRLKPVNQRRVLGKIPLPPLAEQKRIAGILDAADALRAKRREALAELDTLLQSTFLDMFGDPVTNPMGWEVGRLEDCFSETRAGTCCGPFGSALK